MVAATASLAGRLRRAASALLGRGAAAPDLTESVGLEPEFLAIWDVCRPLTMTSVARGYALFKAAEHITKMGLSGDLVECGVWRGGSAMVLAMSMQHFGDASRQLHLFDTFAGMTEPGVFDRSASSGQLLFDRWRAGRRHDGGNDWARGTLDEVKQNLGLTGYAMDRVSFHVGDVRHTLAEAMIPVIALLRLDTDFYESTKAELEHLYPRVVKGGFVIVDDYGHFLGAKKAVDEYLQTNGVTPFLHRIDYTGRLIQIP